jgi:alpha-L-rhamnosidase
MRFIEDAGVATMMETSRGRSAAFPHLRWSGHWIAPEPEGSTTSESGFGSDVAPHEFTRVLFRKTFALDAVPDAAPLRLTADSRYVLFVNGTEIGRGPIRSQPRRLRFDEYDIAEVLKAGENTIAVLVSYYGTANAFWQPAAGNGVFGVDALLVLEAKIGEALIISDDSWRVSRSPAWSEFRLKWVDGVPVENVDAREYSPDWMSGGFDDSSWPDATIMKTSHIGGFGESRPPTDPYGVLLPRGIAALTGDTIIAGEPTDSSPRPIPDWTADHPALRIRQLLVSSAGSSPTSGSLPVSVSLSPDTAHHLEVDFGRIVAGFVEVDVVAPAGTILDLYYREKPWAADPDEGVSAPTTGARYITRGREDGFRALEINGLRYLHLIVYGDAAFEATITGIRVREYHYPEVGDAFFRSNDAEIDRLYKAGIRTVTMNAFDSFTDCPTREQRAWVGDGVVHQMVHLTTNADWALARNYVALGNSPRPDGMLPMTVVGEIEASGGLTIPDWALHWIHGVHNLQRYVGNREEVASYLPTVERVLRWYADYIDDRGTISDVPEWNLVDWASVFSTGRSSIVTALWARGLREFAELSDWVGNNGAADWARGHWERARAGFEDFWDDERGRYVDHFIDGIRMPASSQAAGATAIVSGLAPEDRWSRIIAGITDEETLVVRSWIGSDTGGYDQQKILDQQAGVQRIDWDAEREVVIAEPFFSYVVHDAVALAGRGGDLLRLMRRWSQFLVDGYDTFGECWGWGTPVHGWSSTPTRDLVQHVLGLQPAEPGFGRVRFAPSLGTLTEVEASVPTPHGSVTISISGGKAAITSPVPVTFVASDGSSQDLPAGSSTLAL